MNLAAALNEGRRCLLLARGETAEKIRARIEDAPALMRATSDAQTARLYNRNRTLRLGGERVYRPAGGQTTWLYHSDTERFELVGADDETIATFEDPAAIEDADAYPIDEGMVATENEIRDFDQWTAIKRPLVPALAFDVSMGDVPDQDMWDVIRVPSSSEDGGLEVVESTGSVPLADLFSPQESDDMHGESAPSDGMISLR